MSRLSKPREICSIPPHPRNVSLDRWGLQEASGWVKPCASRPTVTLEIRAHLPCGRPTPGLCNSLEGNSDRLTSFSVCPARAQQDFTVEQVLAVCEQHLAGLLSAESVVETEMSHALSFNVCKSDEAREDTVWGCPVLVSVHMAALGGSSLWTPWRFALWGTLGVGGFMCVRAHVCVCVRARVYVCVRVRARMCVGVGVGAGGYAIATL